MSLNADWSKVDDFKTLHDDETEWRVTEAIIYQMIPIGMWKLTDKNVREFASRIMAWENVNGALLSTYDGENMIDRPITYEDIARRIGLSSNVNSRTKAQFIKALGVRATERGEQMMADQSRALDIATDDGSED